MLLSHSNSDIHKTLVKNINNYINYNQIQYKSIMRNLNISYEELLRHLYGKSPKGIHWFATDLALKLGKDKYYFYTNNFTIEKEEFIWGMPKTAYEFNFTEEGKEGLNMLEELITLIDSIKNYGEEKKEEGIKSTRVFWVD